MSFALLYGERLGSQPQRGLQRLHVIAPVHQLRCSQRRMVQLDEPRTIAIDASPSGVAPETRTLLAGTAANISS
jgi:hypothetical protein